MVRVPAFERVSHDPGRSKLDEPRCQLDDELDQVRRRLAVDHAEPANALLGYPSHGQGREDFAPSRFDVGLAGIEAASGEVLPGSAIGRVDDPRIGHRAQTAADPDRLIVGVRGDDDDALVDALDRAPAETRREIGSPHQLTPNTTLRDQDLYVANDTLLADFGRPVS